VAIYFRVIAISVRAHKPICPEEQSFGMLIPLMVPLPPSVKGYRPLRKGICPFAEKESFN
jgi:hypothetical protein